MGLCNNLFCEAGVSPTAAQPLRVFSVRGLRLISPLRCSAGLHSLLGSPPFVPVYLCASVGPQGTTRHSPCPVLHHSESGPLGLSVCECGAAGPASGQTACRFRPTLRQSQSRYGHASPLHPGAGLCPSYQSRCMFLFYLLGVGLPCPLIFCQFWLCKEAQCIYLRHHLGSHSILLFFESQILEPSDHSDSQIEDAYLKSILYCMCYLKIP